MRKSGRVVECGGLEIRFTVITVTRVRIPPFPPKSTTYNHHFLDLLLFQALCALFCQSNNSNGFGDVFIIVTSNRLATQNETFAKPTFILFVIRKRIRRIFIKQLIEILRSLCSIQNDGFCKGFRMFICKMIITCRNL